LILLGNIDEISYFLYTESVLQFVPIRGGKKPFFTKRTQIENPKSLPVCWMRKNDLASFTKRTHFPFAPGSFKAFQRDSKLFKGFGERKLCATPQKTSTIPLPALVGWAPWNLELLRSLDVPPATFASLCQLPLPHPLLSHRPRLPHRSLGEGWSSNLAAACKPCWLKANRLDG
jgi:hypothetical protein